VAKMDEPTRAQPGDETAELWQELRRRQPWRLQRRHLPWMGLLGLAVALRLTGLASTSVWHDETMTVHTARMGVYEQVVEMSVANNQPPLTFLLFKAWAVVSWSPVWLRLMSVTISLFGVVYAVRWLRLWDSRAGWLAGLLVATSPLMIHYAQEIRGYALLYACTLAGLYFGEQVARQDRRRPRAGLLACACILSYVHYVGSLIAAALWVYALLRGAKRWRVMVLAAAWVALVSPILVLGLFHASDKMETGFWVHPVSGQLLPEMVAAWTGHMDLGIWQAAGAGTTRGWVALILGTLLVAGIGMALITAPARGERDQQLAVATMVGAAFTFVVLVVVFSLVAVPIAIERTTFPAFIPLLGVMAMSGSKASAGWTRLVGTVACVTVACAWSVTWLVRVYGTPERRPQEAQLFEWVAAGLQPGDVIAVFPGQMQASAGYFLQHRAREEQIHSADLLRLEDSADGLRLLPRPHRPEPAWFGNFQLAAAELRQRYPGQHGVWVVDLGPRSVGDPARRRVLEWLEGRYDASESFACGQRWSLSAQRFVPKNAGSHNEP
jgi:mannosyltransferase